MLFRSEYVEIPSDVGITFNVQPKMKAVEHEHHMQGILGIQLHTVCRDVSVLTVIAKKIFFYFLFNIRKSSDLKSLRRGNM